MKFAKTRARLKRLLRWKVQTAAFLIGVLLAAAGAWWIYPPAGLLVAGGLLVLDCYLPAPAPPREEP